MCVNALVWVLPKMILLWLPNKPEYGWFGAGCSHGNTQPPCTPMCPLPTPEIAFPQGQGGFTDVGSTMGWQNMGSFENREESGEPLRFGVKHWQIGQLVQDMCVWLAEPFE